MNLPWFAIVLLGLATFATASVWILGARARVARGEEALPAVGTMALRGALAPVVLVLMANDFADGTAQFLAWAGLVLASWVLTLLCVRALLVTVFGNRTAAPR